MTDRRRSLFVLLLVLGLLAGSLVVISSKTTKLGLDLQGGVQLVYQGEPTAQQPTVTQDALTRAGHHARPRRRVRRRGARAAARGRQPDRGRTSRRRRTPSARPSRWARPRSCSSTTGSRTSSTRRRARPSPDEKLEARQTPITGFYKAVKAASKCDPIEDRQQQRGRRAAVLRVRQDLQATARTTASPPTARRRRSRTSLRQQAKHAEVVEVPTGILVVRDEKPDAERPGPPTAGGWSATTPRSRAPTSRTRSRPPTSRPATSRSSPSSFTKKGREAFHAITKQIAERGVRQLAAGRQPASSRRSTSRSCSTTSSSRRRTSTTTRTRTASTARPARRSPARSRSTRRRTWRRSSRSARCRSGST